MDEKASLRCCCICKRPWQSDVSTVNDLATRQAFKVHAFFKFMQQKRSKNNEYLFEAEYEDCHIIQKRHQQEAIDDFLEPGKQHANHSLPLLEPSLKTKLDKVKDRELPTLPVTVPGCKSCNNIMDCRGKLREVLFQSIIPRNLTPKLQRPRDAQDNMKTLYILFLNEFDGKIEAYVGWFALMVYARWVDLQRPATAKPMYIYKGMLNLYISLFMYILLCLDNPSLPCSFLQFHTFLFEEVPYSIKDNYTRVMRFQKVHDLVFELWKPVNNHKSGFLSTCERLVSAYEKYIRPCIEPINQNFYVNFSEIAVLCQQVPPKDARLQEHFDKMGAFIMLTPLRRLLCYDDDSDLQEVITDWIVNVVKHIECDNIAKTMNITKEDALTLYQMQYTLRYDHLLQKHKNFLTDYDPDECQQYLRHKLKCSMFKAWFRLQKIGAFKASSQIKYLTAYHSAKNVPSVMTKRIL